MAVNKQYTTVHGVNASFHKIQKVELLVDENRVDILFAIYLNQAAIDMGRVPLYYRSVSIPLDSFEKDPRSIFYNAAKRYNNSYLVGCLDDVEPGTDLNMENVLRVKPEHSVGIPTGG